MEKKENYKITKSMKPHIAILPSPGMGHIIPLLELAKRLVTFHGFHVTFFVFPAGTSPAQTQLLKSSSNLAEIDVVDLSEIEIPDTLNDLNFRLIYIVTETLKTFKQSLLNLPYLPNAVIIDMFGVDAFDTTKELSIPTYMFFTASASFLSLLLYFPTFNESINGDYTKLPESVQAPGCNSIFISDIININDYRQGVPTFKRFLESDGILVNSFEEIEPESLRALLKNPFFVNLRAPPVYPIGPLIKTEDEEGKEDECINWLNKQDSDSVLFVSFGSGGTLFLDQITELAYGFEQSNQRFIWVVRNPNGDTCSGSYFNVGSNENESFSFLPDGFLERTKERGKVVSSWAAQVSVLAHDSTGGFLTHCGWNSILESLVHGVPMIAWPLFADQKINARILCEELRVAVRPEVGSSEKMVVGRDEIERVVRLVMENEDGKVMRSRAKELQDFAKKSQVGSSSCLTNVVQEWKL